MKPRIKFYNTVSRILFLMLTPVFFRVFNFAFIWHSIYWGVITFVVLIWMTFIVLSPLVGRIGCGWFCFMGTVQDLNYGNSLIKLKRKKPLLWIRFILPVMFLTSSLTFFFIHVHDGTIQGIRFIPDFFGTDLNTHYQHVWFYDTLGAILSGILLEKRWACRNLCFMGSMCAIGANYSRLLPVLDTTKCNGCKKCETVCLVNIPITDYIDSKKGLVTNSECLLCGKCTDVCAKKAITIQFVWNRKKYIRSQKSNSVQIKKGSNSTLPN